MSMPEPGNIKAFNMLKALNDMLSIIADTYKNVSKTLMTEVAEHLRRDNIWERTRPGRFGS